MDLCLKDMLKIEATALAGLFAGNAMYINAAAHPARKNLDTAVCRKVWKEEFLRAKKFQGGMVVAGTIAGLGAFYLDESDRRMLWLAGSGVFLSIFPYTLIFMFPDIKKNLADDVMETAGETWIRNHINRWNKQHMVRTVLGFTSFGIFLYALCKN
ncbi:hypothetical protein ACF0H5_018898 [Mactra antiquata]